jgi:uncharacterized MAPEG superfamily protein
MKLGLDNNIEPRETLAKLEKSGKVSPAVLKKLKRHLAAQQNGFESLVMMAAAVVSCETRVRERQPPIKAGSAPEANHLLGCWKPG